MNKIFCIIVSILLSIGVANAQLSFTGGGVSTYAEIEALADYPAAMIDASAGSTTITLYAGYCPTIHNLDQAAADIDNTLPAVGAGKCFVALARTAQGANYWRLTAAAADTVCLNRTCGKDYIQMATPAVGDMFTCFSDGVSWHCYDYDESAEAGDL